jgi:[protein-PII] uridylyltransferase
MRRAITPPSIPRCSIASARWFPPAQHDALKQFLEGLPQRYLQTRLPEQIRHHFQMALNLDSDPVQLDLRPNRQLFDLTVITRDRTRLFADVAGVLARGA